MMHLHLSRCENTQKAVFELIDDGEESALVSCERQSAGQGRRMKEWFDAENSIAMSFTLDPNQRLTLTAMEIGLLSSKFLEEKFGIKTFLKWPNDIYLKNGRKCGGILVQGHSGRLVAGVGINLFHKPGSAPKDLERKLGGLFQKPVDVDEKSLAYELYSFILTSRLGAPATVKEWMQRCFHLDREVEAHEEDSVATGLFRGIGEDGHAMIETKSGVVKIYNATLRVK